MSQILHIILFLVFSSPYVLTADDVIRESFKPFSVLTNQFLSTVQPKNNLKFVIAEIVKIFNGSSHSEPSETFKQIAPEYLGYLILAAIGVVFILFFTLVASICFCKCSCCKSRNPPPLNKNKKTKRHVLNCFVFIFTSFMIVGGIVGIVGCSIVLQTLKPVNATSTQDSTPRNVYTNINTAFDSLGQYSTALINNIWSKGVPVINNAIASVPEIIFGLGKDFIELILTKTDFRLLINESKSIIHASTELKTTAELLENVSQIHNDRNKPFISTLQNISTTLREILETACNNSNDCSSIRSQLPILIGYNVSQINYTMELYIFNASQSLNTSALNKSISSFENAIQSFSNIINETLATSINEFQNKLESFNLPQKVSSLSNASLLSLSNSLAGVKLEFNKFANNNADAIYSGGQIGFYSLIAVGAIILIICLFFYLGLCFGVCGGPNFEDAPACSKGKGRSMFLCAFGTACLVSWLIMLVVMLMFLVGGLFYTEGCRYVIPTASPEYFKTMDEVAGQFISAQNFAVTKDVTLALPTLKYYSGLLIQCRTNVTVAVAFGLPDTFVQLIVNAYIKEFMQPIIATIVKRLSDKDFGIVNEGDLKASLKNLTDTINNLQDPSESTTITELQKPVTNIQNLTNFYEMISRIVTSLNSNGQSSDANNLDSTLNTLKSQINFTETLRFAYLASKTQFKKLRNDIINLRKSINNKFDTANNNIKIAKDQAVIMLKTSLTHKTMVLINTTLYSFMNTLGNCSKASDSIINVVNTVCDDLLNPFNNIWMGYGWYLLFIIATIAMAMAVGNLYSVSYIQSSVSIYNQAYMPSNEFLKLNRPQKS